jgi:hypothetical protein
MATVPQRQTKPQANRTVIVRLTPAQSDTWILGPAAATNVAQALADQLAELDFHGHATVLLDDSSVAFGLEVAYWRGVTNSVPSKLGGGMRATGLPPGVWKKT